MSSDKQNSDNDKWTTYGLTAFIIMLLYGYRSNAIIRKVANVFILIFILLAILTLIIPIKTEKDIQSEYYNSLKNDSNP